MSKLRNPVASALRLVQGSILKAFGKYRINDVWFVECFDVEDGENGPLLDFQIFIDEEEMDEWIEENISAQSKFVITHKQNRTIHSEWQTVEGREDA